MVEVKRKKGESFDALMRRFQRRYQESGRGLQMKKIRFLEDAPNKTRRRASALRREELREKFEYELKTGTLPEEKTKKKGFRR